MFNCILHHNKGHAYDLKLSMSTLWICPYAFKAYCIARSDIFFYRLVANILSSCNGTGCCVERKQGFSILEEIDFTLSNSVSKLLSDSKIDFQITGSKYFFLLRWNKVPSELGCSVINSVLLPVYCLWDCCCLASTTLCF